ncbi:MAG: hypothetical protein EXR79_05565 [Myxococcales bacterium]|nr:hypothetical protein [Myxococcales bacterium]
MARGQGFDEKFKLWRVDEGGQVLSKGGLPSTQPTAWHAKADGTLLLAGNTSTTVLFTQVGPSGAVQFNRSWKPPHDATQVFSALGEAPGNLVLAAGSWAAKGGKATDFARPCLARCVRREPSIRFSGLWCETFDLRFGGDDGAWCTLRAVASAMAPSRGRAQCGLGDIRYESAPRPPDDTDCARMV